MSTASKYLRALRLVVAWAWTIVAAGGGLGLIITEGPLPLTHGWFALASGLSLCPLTAWLARRYLRVTLPPWVQLLAAVLFIAAGRVALRLQRGYW